MIRKISSEFDCLDSAERAVAAMKNSIPDISSISIKQKKDTINNNNQQYEAGFFVYAPFGQFLPYGTNLYGLQALNSSSNQYNTNQPQEVILYIVCANESIQNVSSMLTNYGGLKIKEQ